MRKYFNISLFLLFIFMGGCEDEVKETETSSVELSIVRADTVFQLSWTMNNDPDFFKYLVKTGTEPDNVSEVIFESTDRTTLTHAIPYSAEEKYFKVDVSNLEYETFSSNIVNINTEILYPLSDEFRRCAEESRIVISLPSNETTSEYDYVWDGLIKNSPHPVSVDGQIIRVDTTKIHYDQYGNIILVDYTGWEDPFVFSTQSYTYSEYWKLVQSINNYTDGGDDVSDTINYTWDGLIRTSDQDDSYSSTYNEYGRLMSSTSGNYFSYYDDGRRWYEYEHGDWRGINIWNGLQFEEWIMTDGYTSLKTGEVDIYGNTIEQIIYDCQSGACEPALKETVEYDCNKFDPIPIE